MLFWNKEKHSPSDKRIIDKLLASFVAISHLKIVCEEVYSSSASLFYPFLPRLDLTDTQA